MYKCKKCNKIFISRTAMYNHFSIVHKVPIVDLKRTFRDFVEEAEDFRPTAEVKEVKKEVKNTKKVNKNEERDI